MSNKNKLKRKWSATVLVCALAMMAMLAAAPAWAFVATVHNTTKETVTVEAFEIKSPEMIKSLGKKKLEPGWAFRFKPNSGFCIDHYEGWYSSRTSASQHWTKRANSNGAHCGNQLVSVKRDKYGNFFFKIE